MGFSGIKKVFFAMLCFWLCLGNAGLYGETPTPVETDSSKIWWNTACRQINKVLQEQGRDVVELENPKWFETSYFNLGRMPLVDTCLREPLNGPQIAIYFDDLIRKKSDQMAAMLDIADQMCNQVADVHPWDKLPKIDFTKEQTKELEDCFEELDATKTIPEDIKKIFRTLISATAQASFLRDKAYSAFTPEERKRVEELMPQFFVPVIKGKASVRGYTCDNATAVELAILMQKVDYESLLQAGYILARAGDEAIAVLKALPPQENPNQNIPDMLFEKNIFIGKIGIGGSGKNIYKEDYAVLLDLGGNDQYLNGAARTSLSKLGAAVLLDISGDDIYTSEGCAQSSALAGVTLLIDLAGDDQYTSKHYSQCAAIGGVALLFEGAGNDTYIGDVGVQSFAIFGYSLMSERGGTDLYRCFANGQAGASTMGVAVLAENEGDDTYRAGGKYDFYTAWDSSTAQGAASGLRPWPVRDNYTLYGGVGFLSEAAGNDTYSACNISQGSAYIFAFGGLVDSAGNDTYLSKNYARGTGVHLAAGVFIDKEGEDIYRGDWGNDGIALDRSIGVFLDLAGNDYYRSWRNLGYAIKEKGCGIAVDVNGDDVYNIMQNDSLGSSDPYWGDDSASAAFFLDFDGADFYSGNLHSNNSSWKSDIYGYGEDFKTIEPVKEKKEWWKPESVANNRGIWRFAPYKEGEDLASPFTLTRFAAQRRAVNKAPDNFLDIFAVIAQGSPTIKYQAIDLFHALLLGKKLTPQNAPLLTPLLKNPDRDARLLALYGITRTGCTDEKTHDQVAELIESDPAYDVRGFACLTVCRAKQEKHIAKVINALQDGNWRVRRRAALGLVAMPHKDAFKPLSVVLLSDPAFAVRWQALNVIAQYDLPEVPGLLQQAENDANELVRFSAAKNLLLNYGQKQAILHLINLVKWNNGTLRNDIVIAFLENYTGKKFGADMSKWKQWWEAEGTRLDVKLYTECIKELNVALQQYYTGKKTEGLDALRKLHKKLPGHEVVSAKLVEFLSETAWETVSKAKNIPEAMRLAEESAAIKETPAILDTLAVLWSLQGNKDKAVETINRALTMAPENEKAPYKQRLEDIKAGKIKLNELE
jgi:tetratricopeptide (TPR) repeat protein